MFSIKSVYLKINLYLLYYMMGTVLLSIANFIWNRLDVGIQMVDRTEYFTTGLRELYSFINLN